jgi:predicted nucleic acid-binding protein
VTAVIVADAGPLIGLARIGRVSVLTSLYGSVVVPELVLAELHVDSERPRARALSAALAEGAIRQQALPDASATELARLGLLLDAGEAPAILLAEQTDCRFLLIDERRGRQIARARGIPVVGLAGVLLAAKRSGLLPSVASTLADLSREGYRLSDALVREVLRLAGEAESPGQDSGNSDREVAARRGGSLVNYGRQLACADGELERPGGLRGWWIRPAPASAPHGNAGSVDSHSSISASRRAVSLSRPSERV